MKDYYSILGLERNATTEEIKKSYRKLAAKFHPDKNPEDEEFFEQMFRNVKEAYDVLSDERLRASYDRSKGNSSFQEKPQAQSKKSGTEEHKSKNGRKTSKKAPDDIVKSSIDQLKKMVKKTNGLELHSIKTSAIVNNLLKIFTPNNLLLFRSYNDYARASLIHNTLELFEYLDSKQRGEIIPKLLTIASGNLEFVNAINNSALKPTRKKPNSGQKSSSVFQKQIIRSVSYLRSCITTLIKYGIILYVIYLVISAIGYVIDRNNDEEKTSTSDLPPIEDLIPKKSLSENLPELNFELSRWKGNQLETGASPYNSYFGKGIYDNSSNCYILVKNGQTSDVIVCVVQYLGANRTIRNEYIRAGATFKMTKIPPGTYYLKQFYGNDWNPTLVQGSIKGFFETNTGFSKSDRLKDLLRLKPNTYYEVTLYPVSGGNMESIPINSTDFFK